jgi:serine/threonine protein kinase/WD40 repeat protein
MTQDSPPSAHPAPQLLRAFNLGRLDDEQTLAIGTHLEGCPACCQALRDLPTEDRFVGRVRAAADSTGPGRVRPDLGRCPERLGDYHLVREVGRGGMGVVYEAEQRSLGRRVALKVLPIRALTETAAVERFRREARLAARLHHTNIVPVFEVGQDGDTCFYAMQFIPGHSLDRLLTRLRDPQAGDAEPSCGSGDLGRGARSPGAVPDRPGDGPEARTDDWRSDTSPVPPAVLDSGAQSRLLQRWDYDLVARVGLQAAQALTYAHGRGVLHRDIKPSNLLLDESGVVWVTDFGLAKGEGDDLTKSGDFLGTLRYMAPERFRGACDARADVYGLGLTLYELLTLRPAFSDSDQARLLDQVHYQNPPRPRSVDPRIPRDLETVVLKAMDKDPARRYQTADDLADDLQRFLDRRPTRARAVGPAERLGRWARRHPAVAGLLCAVAAALLGGTAVSSYFAIEAGRRARDADLASDAARGAEGRAVASQDAARRQSAALLFERGLQTAEQKDVAEGLPWMVQALREMPEQTDEDRAFRRMLRVNLAAWARLLPRPLAGCDAVRVACAAFSPDGRTLATGDYDGRIRLWDAQTLRPRGEPLVHKAAGTDLPYSVRSLAALAFSPDGRMLLAGYGPEGGPSRRGGMALRWDLATGKVVGEPLRHPEADGQKLWAEAVSAVAWSPDGRLILTGHPRVVRVWDATTGEAVGRPWEVGTTPRALAFGPDGRSVAVATGEIWADGGWQGKGDVQVWEVAHGERLAAPFVVPPRGDLHSLAWSADGGRLVASNEDRYSWLLRWDAARRAWGENPVRLNGAYPLLTPDGRGAVLRDYQTHAVRVWDLGSYRPAAARLAPAWAGLTALHPDGEALLRGTELWRLARPLSRPAADVPGSLPSPAPPAAGSAARAAFAPDARTVVVHAGTVLQRWDTARGVPVGTPVRDVFRGFQLSPDGRQLAGCVPDSPWSTVRIWDLAGTRPLEPVFRHPDNVRALALSPEGRTLAAGTYGLKAYLYDAATGRPLGQPLPQNDIVMSLAFSPDGRLLAVGTAFDWSHAPQTRFWDVETRRPLGEPMPAEGDDRVERLLFRPDGRAILACCLQTARLWEVPTGRPVSPPITLGGHVEGIAFSPDGSRFVAGGPENTVRLWSGATGAPLGPPLKGPARPTDAAFSPDGSLLVVGYADGSARLWDVPTFQPLGPPVVQRSAILAVAWDADGRRFYTVSADGCPRAWPVPEPLTADPERIGAALEVATTLRLDPGRAVSPLDRDAWLARRRAWQDEGGSFDAVLGPPLSDEDWHDARARDAEEDGEPFAARWHLDRLIALRPDDWRLHARRGRTYTEEERWDLAEADYRRARERGAGDGLTDWFRYRAQVCEARGRAAAGRWYQEHASRERSND